ncbi:hypothetical protein ES703_53602 [subsurface metagenome]
MKFLKKLILIIFTALFLLSMSSAVFADGDGIPDPDPLPILPGEVE